MKPELYLPTGWRTRRHNRLRAMGLVFILACIMGGIVLFFAIMEDLAR